MDYSIDECDGGIVIRNAKDFNIKHTFDCGQCFRWHENDDKSYSGITYGRAVRVSQQGCDIYIKGGKVEDKNFWINYFDLDRDYGEIKKELSKDATLNDAVKYGDGIRILNQEPFEITVSYIISANNRIPMIMRAVENISKMFGNKIEFDGKEYYSFPDVESLSKATVSELEKCGCGFRAPYIVDTVQKLKSGESSLSDIQRMKTDDAAKELMKLKGIGPKVADCIMLFSMGKYDAFPVDVWVKRVMQYLYLAPDVSLKKIRDFARDKFGDIAGFAQEYLFYYARTFKKKEGLEK